MIIKILTICFSISLCITVQLTAMEPQYNEPKPLEALRLNKQCMRLVLIDLDGFKKHESVKAEIFLTNICTVIETKSKSFNNDHSYVRSFLPEEINGDLTDQASEFMKEKIDDIAKEFTGNLNATEQTQVLQAMKNALLEAEKIVFNYLQIFYPEHILGTAEEFLAKD